LNPPSHCQFFSSCICGRAFNKVYVLRILLFAVLAFAGCTKPDRSEERRVGASAGMGDSYYSALLLLNGLLERNGEWGKALRLADEIIADVENDRETSGISEEVALRVKSRALIAKGDCEKDLGHPDETERFYLEAIDLMMDSVKHSDDYWVTDGLVMAVLETTEFYLEVDRPEKALALVAKGDTALARFDRCPDVPGQVHHYRHNNDACRLHQRLPSAPCRPPAGRHQRLCGSHCRTLRSLSSHVLPTFQRHLQHVARRLPQSISFEALGRK